MKLRRRSEMRRQPLEHCHKGVGTLECRHVLEGGDSGKPGIAFMHDDILPPGVSIGEHLHDHEEVYYVISGTGTLYYDGETLPMGPGDVSLVTAGHSHGLANTGSEDLRLVVVGLRG